MTSLESERNISTPHWWKDAEGETETLEGGEHVPTPMCKSQTQYVGTWDGTRASDWIGEQQTSSVEAWSCHVSYVTGRPNV